MNNLAKIIISPLIAMVLSVPSGVPVSAPTLDPVAEIVSVLPVPEQKDRVNKYGMTEELESVIEKKFGKDGRIMVAVALYESGGGKYDAHGFNCIIGGRSVPCPKEQRPQAWSSDCGLMQINTRGTLCPDHLMDPIKNIDVAYSIYKSQGLNAWFAYKDGLYLKYMDYDSVYTVVDNT